MIDPRRPDYACTPASAHAPSFRYRPADPSLAPLVSVITPFYNESDTERFEETARCVLGQSLQRFEWIIVNDGSDCPAALDLLDRFRNVRRDPRVRVVDHDENRGLPAARNTGYREASAEFVFQIDSDDLIEPTAIEKCLWTLTFRPDLAFCGGYSVGFGAQEYLWTRGFHDGPAFLKENLVTATKMVRKSAWEAAGGFDESMRGGLEDWAFWLACADKGRWGHTIPEYLDWYRRRENQHDDWENLGCDQRNAQVLAELRDRHPKLFDGPFPTPRPKGHPQWAHQPGQTPWANPLAKEKRRLLIVLPWLRLGGADKFNRDLLDQMTHQGWEVTVATTNVAPHPWLSEFSSITPDVFLLDHLAQPLHYATMLRGLIESRRPDVVLMSNSEFGYAVLPALRSLCPEPAYVDYCHMEEEHWKFGGHPRTAVGAQSQLELNITSSEHLKNWMIERGSDPSRIAVANTNIDPEVWKPDPELRAEVRRKLGVDEDTTVILYAGRICPQKQPMVFAETMRRLRDKAVNKGKRFVALVAGSGEDEAALAERLAGDGMLQRGEPGGEVRLLGETINDEMRGLMAAADIFFMPSEWEGIALVLFESMATETVFVGAVVGGQVEVLTPDCGVLLPKAKPGRELIDEPPAYADRLMELISNPEKLRAMAGAGRERICKHYTLDAMGERMDSLLKRAIELKRREPRSTLPKAAAVDLLERAIETDRLQRSIDHLWREHQRVKARNAELRGKLQETRGRTQRMERRLGRLTPSPAKQLEAIEASRAWGMVRKFKSNPVYAGYARLRYGSSWRDQLDKGSPAQRLARIQGGKAYRLLSALKALRGLPPVGGPMGDLGGSGRKPAPRKRVEKESRVELNGAVAHRPPVEPPQAPAKPAQDERSTPPVVVRQKDMASGRSR